MGILCILFYVIFKKYYLNNSDYGDLDFGDLRDAEHFAEAGNEINMSVEGVRNNCLICEEDKMMERLHKIMWMRGGTKVDDVANWTGKIIGAEINKDTEKYQKKVMGDAKRLALK